MSASPRFPSFGTFARTHDRYVMSVLSKRTYRWTPHGDVAPLEVQPALTRDITLATREDRNCEVLQQGRDTWPIKRATDVVVTGHVQSPLGLPVRKVDVEVRIGEHVRRIVAIGPRFVDYRGNGVLSFSEPEPFLAVELNWWNAYGGIDPAVLPKGLKDTPLFLGKPVLELFPGTYPRNPCGTGYLIRETREYLEGLTLPQLEDPANLLHPRTLLVGEATDWWRRPAPANLGWYNAMWYPRILHTGGKPYHLPPPTAAPVRVAPEPSAEDKDLPRPEPGQPSPSLDVLNEASPELILPFLNGDETIGLTGFGTRDRQQFRLPRVRPKVAARADGLELAELGCHIHTLVIDVDKHEFYLLYSNRFEIPDELAGDLYAGLTRTEIASRCEVRIDGHPLAPEDWPLGEEED